MLSGQGQQGGCGPPSKSRRGPGGSCPGVCGAPLEARCVQGRAAGGDVGRTDSRLLGEEDTLRRAPGGVSFGQAGSQGRALLSPDRTAGAPCPGNGRKLTSEQARGRKGVWAEL